MNKFCIIIVTLMLYSVSAHAESKRIALLGDSIIYFAHIENTLREYLPNSVIDNYGVPCNTPFDIKDRIQLGHGDVSNKILDPSKYDTIIVLAGYNGLGRGATNHNGSIRGLSLVYAKLKALSSAKIIALTMQPFGRYKEWSPILQYNTWAVNKWIVSIPINVDFVIDLNNSLLDPGSTSERPLLDSKLTNDGLHLNRAGGKVIGDLLYPFLKD